MAYVVMSSCEHMYRYTYIDRYIHAYIYVCLCVHVCVAFTLVMSACVNRYMGTEGP